MVGKYIKSHGSYTNRVILIPPPDAVELMKVKLWSSLGMWSSWWWLESWFMLIMRCVDSQSKVGFLGYSWWNLKIVEFLGDVILSDCADLSSSQKHGTSTSWKKQHICFVPGLWHLFWVIKPGKFCCSNPSPGYTNQVSEKNLRFRKNLSWNPLNHKLALAQLFFSGKLSASQAFGGSKKKQGPGVAQTMH